jgi:hypothetical protein
MGVGIHGNDAFSLENVAKSVREALANREARGHPMTDTYKERATMAETIIAPTELSDEQIDMILDAAKVPTTVPDCDVQIARAILAHLADELRDAARYRWLCEQDTGDRIFIATGRNGAWGECGHSSFGGFKDIADREIDALMPPSPESKP